MKTLRVILTVSAFLFAIGGAIASRTAVAEDGYEFIDRADPLPDECRFIDDICDDGMHPCKVNSASPQLKRWIGSATTCGVDLKRSTAPPAP